MFQGTLLLVPGHDRQFVDNTVTHSWIFEGDGSINKFVGGYHDAQQQREQYLKAITQNDKAGAASNRNVDTEQKTAKPKSKPKKLSYKLQRELEGLPAQLEALESEIETLQSEMNDPDFFSKSQEVTQPKLTRLAEVEHQLEQAFERWEALEAMQQESE